MTRETFLSRRPATKTFTLADGESVTIRKLTQREVETIRRDYATDAKALEGIRYTVSRAVVDEQGVRLFTDADVSALADQDVETILAIGREITEFSGLAKPEPAGK